MTSPLDFEELAELQHKRIACGIPWCVGRALDHGADGAGPEVWLHEGREEPVYDVLTLSRVREGAGPDRYSVVVDLPAERDFDAAGLHDLATRMRRSADALDARAELLEGPVPA